MIEACSDYKKALPGSTIQMRDEERMTFRVISEALIHSG
jgi:hypothetical protein